MSRRYKAKREDACRTNLDTHVTCVWLGEQTRATARDRTGAAGSISGTRYHAAMAAQARRSVRSISQSFAGR